MRANPIDKLAVYQAIKDKVDAAHKLAKQEAQDFFYAKRDEDGTASLTSPMFGAEAGKFQCGRTKAKKEVEYHLADDVDFAEWLEANQDAAFQFAKLSAADLGKWWFDSTGEVPDGVSRVEVDIPSALTAPKFYSFDPSAVEEKLGANLFEEADRLLLGDGDD